MAAVDSVQSGFKTQDRGKLIMACGTGKTFTSLKIAEKTAGTNLCCKLFWFLWSCKPHNVVVKRGKCYFAHWQYRQFPSKFLLTFEFSYEKTKKEHIIRKFK
ncbi:MAG: DEAD/DEAH box helicase family protein [Thermoguttaceae bacterium]